MRILAIETSCDETAIAIVDVHPDKSISILANEILSQAALHQEFGGVFPALAKREHGRTLAPLLIQALSKARLLLKLDVNKNGHKDVIKEVESILSREGTLREMFFNDIISLKNPDITRIVVTQGPGLEPALWVGINFAKALGLVWNIPVIPVNHMEGHILVAIFDQTRGMFRKVTFPLVALLISGGHTELVRVDGFGKYSLLGETKDDAVGECFDKVARILGLPYPGGPEISRIGENGKKGVYPLPRPMLDTKNCDFSFSGLKTAVLYLTKKLGVLSDDMKADIAREFEESVTEVLSKKTLRAIEETGAKGLVVGGGVSANRRIRSALSMMCEENRIPIYLPDTTLSTDNALMIALGGAMAKETKEPLSAKGNWKIHDSL